MDIFKWFRRKKKVVPEPSIYFLKAKSLIEDTPLEVFEKAWDKIDIFHNETIQDTKWVSVRNLRQTQYGLFFDAWSQEAWLLVEKKSSKLFMSIEEREQIFQLFTDKLKEAREYELKKLIENEVAS